LSDRTGVSPAKNQQGAVAARIEETAIVMLAIISTNPLAMSRSGDADTPADPAARLPRRP
jgi:hypothetical protein